MSQKPASTAFLHVAYRADSHLLVGRWLCSINDEQLREGYETLRRAALEHSCGNWLIDARRRVDRRHNGPEWVVTTFLPQVQAELGTALNVAFLVLPNHLRELEAESGPPICSANAANLLQYTRFTEEGPANAWLGLLCNARQAQGVH